MRKIILNILPFIFFLIQLSNAKDYQWPLKINNGYSGSFMEYRTGHFHGGYDIRTFQKNGYPVYAPTNGELIKISSKKRGSGLSLYLKANDGNQLLFLHLSKLGDQTYDIFKKRAELKGRFFGAYKLPKPIKVKQGDLIAYTGESGAGFPHLHFEIRDKFGYTINPAHITKFPKKDYNLPKIKNISFMPLKGSQVNFSCAKQRFRFVKTKKGVFTLKKVIHFSGSFHMNILAFDISDSGRNVAPSSISFTIDKEKVFCLKFEKFSWAQHNELGFVYDLSLSSSSFPYYNLFFQKGFNLEKLQKNFSEYLKNLSYGKHQLTITLKDKDNNQSKANITLFKHPKNNLEVKSHLFENNNLIIQFNNEKIPLPSKLAIKIFNVNNKIINSGDVGLQEELKDNLITLRGLDNRARKVKIQFIYDNIIYKTIIYNLIPKKYEQKLHNNLFAYNNFIRYVLNNNNISSVELNDELSLTTQSMMKGKKKFIEIEGEFLNQGINSIKLDDNNYIKFNIIKLIPLKINNYKMDNFSVYFAKKSVKENKLMLVKKFKIKSSYPSNGSAYSLEPASLPFLDAVDVSFKAKLKEPYKWGIFKKYHRGKIWWYCYTRYNPTNSTYYCRLRNGGDFALLKDIYKPKILIQTIGTNSFKTIKGLRVIITDKGKGVNDNTIKVKINKKSFKDFFYDHDHKSLVIWKNKKFKKGKNTIFVSVYDKAKNYSSKTIVLNLK